MSDIPKEIYINKSETFNTNTVFLRGFSGFATQINVTNGSTFSATVYVQLSNDNVNWVTLENDPILMSGASDVALFDVPITSASYYRLNIEFIGGSADFLIIYNVKEK